MSNSELSIIEAPEAVPRVLVLDPSGENHGETLVAAACLRRQQYEPVLVSPFPVREEDVRIPEKPLSGGLALISLRLGLKKRNVEQILRLPGRDGAVSRAAKLLLPAKMTRELEEDEESLLLAGFAVGAAARTKALFGSLAEEEDGASGADGESSGPGRRGDSGVSVKGKGLTLAIPGVADKEVEQILPFFDRVADKVALFEEAQARFLLLPPVPDALAQRIRKRGLAESVVIFGENRSALDYYRAVARADGVMNLAMSGIYWAAACNKPIVTSTRMRPPKEVRTLSVYYSGGHIEEIAEKVIAGQMDRESLSYVRLSPHLFVDVTEASLKGRCARLRGVLASE